MRRAAALAAVVAAACGGEAARRAPPPDVLEVVALRPGAAADTIDAKLALPISRALATIDRGIAGVSARARPGRASVIVEIAPGFALEAVRADVQAAISAIGGHLRPEAEVIRVDRVFRDVALGRYLLGQGGMSPAEAAARWRRLDRDLVPVPGVLGQRACGAAAAEVRVTVDPERARALGLDVVDVTNDTRVGDTKSVDDVGSWYNPVAAVALADIGTVELDAIATCTAVTSEGAGIATTTLLGGTRRAESWARVLAAARAAGDVRELPASATLIASLDAPREPGTILAAMVAIAARPDVRWTIVEAEAAEVRLSVGVERGADVGAIAGLVEAAVPRGTGLHVTGAGLVVREAVIRADDATPERAAAAAATLAGTGGIASAGCIGCALTELTEPTIDPARLTPGLEPARVARALEIATSGFVIHQLALDGDVVPVRVVVDHDPSVPRGVLAGITVRAVDQDHVPLADVAPTTVRRAPTTVLREAGERVVVVWARGVPGAIADDVDRALRAAFPDAAIRPGRPAF